MRQRSTTLILLLIFLMIFSPVLANNYENIDVDEKGNLILTPEQYVALADYIEELHTRIKQLESQLEQANKELELAYEKKGNDIDITGKVLSGAAIAALILILAN